MRRVQQSSTLMMSACWRWLGTHTRLSLHTALSADVRLSGLELDALARPRFRVDTPWGNADVELATSGAHMASNAAAAIAVAGSVGVSLNAAVEALATASISGMRMEVSTAPSGATVINDAYNANPTSMVRHSKRWQRWRLIVVSPSSASWGS